MKTILSIAFTFIFTLSFAQQDMFWNDYSNFNPAMSGFQYQQHGAISYSDFLRSDWSGKELSANYNMRLAQKHGIGVNFSGYSHTSFYNSSNVVANYNYQFDLNEAGKLSTGIGAGVNVLNINSHNIPEPLTHLQLNIGVGYKWKGLTAGISIQNIAQRRAQLIPGFFSKTKPVYAIHASYDFNLGKRFQLTPRAIFEHNYGYTELNGALSLTFDKKFSIGALYAFHNEIGFHAGWNIKEKFRVAYSVKSSFSSFTQSFLSYTRQELTLGFQLR